MKEFIFQRHLVSSAQYFPDKTAIIDGGYSASYLQHLNRVTKVSRALKSRYGLSANERFSVLATDSHRYLELWHAALCGAAVINPLNIRLNTAELVKIAQHAEPSVLFFEEKFHEAAEQIAKATPSVRAMICLDTGEHSAWDEYEDMLGEIVVALPEEPSEDDQCALIYTGGTTGLPKGAIISQRNAVLTGYKCIHTLNLSGSSCFLSNSPFFHTASSTAIVALFMCGGGIVLLPKFDAEVVIDTIEKHSITDVTLMTATLAMVLRHEKYASHRLRSLRQITYGGAAIHLDMPEKLRMINPDLRLSYSYGMTEAFGTVSLLTDADHRVGGKIMKSAGRPILGTQVTIQDENDAVVPVGCMGEICVRGGTVMNGYWRNSDATQDALKGGWLHTGDAGYVDESGYLYVVDRIKDMIKSGGENVYSFEVEQALGTHPEVKQAAVIGLPHEIWGESVHAIVAVAESSTVTESELQQHVRKSLAGFKVPKSIELRYTPLPLSAMGKVQKHILRLQLERSQPN